MCSDSVEYGESSHPEQIVRSRTFVLTIALGMQAWRAAANKVKGGEGSREQKKWVKEYDDYRIEKSPRWRLVAYHYVKVQPQFTKVQL
eukprot:4237204-Pyramimonas_sp.AAC.1